MRSAQIKDASYHLHLMIALAASLLVVIICIKLPIRLNSSPKPWKPNFQPHGTNTEIEQTLLILSPATSLESIGSTKGTDMITTPFNEIIFPKDTIPETTEPHLHEATTVPVLDHAEIMPEIRGGMRAYYILIDYPEEAINQEIEGRLTLTFTVNPDGTANDILVTQPLHALLDSAAVQALRRTRFIPGQHLGKSVRIRMRLPVRFELVEPTDSTITELLPPEDTPK